MLKEEIHSRANLQLKPKNELSDYKSRKIIDKYNKFKLINKTNYFKELILEECSNNLKPFNSTTNSINLTKTTFKPVNIEQFNNIMKSKIISKNIFSNDKKLFRSVSPNRNMLIINKTDSPIREKLKVTSKMKSSHLTKNNLVKSLNIGESNIRNNSNQLGSVNISDQYITKSNYFNNTHRTNNSLNINLNTKTLNFNQLENKKLPDLNINANLKDKQQEIGARNVNLLNEKKNEILKKFVSHRPSNSYTFQNTTNPAKLHFKNEKMEIRSKSKGDLPPDTNKEVLIIKDNFCEKIIFPRPLLINKNSPLVRKNSGSKIMCKLFDTTKINENTECESSQKRQSYIGKYSSKSKAGVTYDGRTKTNQDSFLLKTKIFNLENYSLFGVFDGHGSHGHFISNMIKIFLADYFSRINLFLPKENFPISNSHNLKIRNKWNNNGTIKEEIVYEKLTQNNHNFIKTSFFLAESALMHSKYEVNFSGATCVVVIIVNDKIICANAGDSRAILISGDTNLNNFQITPLSRDHKPELQEENSRIIKNGGRVEKYTENGVKSGPYRVWLKNENFPGLAMSRSVGDFVAESVGVICEPEIFEFTYDNNCKFIVIASDGIWEFLTNERVAEIVSFYYKSNDPNMAAQKLVEEAVKMWKAEDEVIDDITAVIIFFNKSN